MNSNERTLDEPAEVYNGNEDPSIVDGASLSTPERNNNNRSTPSQLTVDAVHPFFTSYRNVDQYYCSECNENFETSPKALKFHFKNKNHTSEQNCTYCNLPVYEYIHNGNQLYYHRCYEEETKSKTEEDTGNDVDGSSNTLFNSSTLDQSFENLSQCNSTVNSDMSTDNTSV